MNKFNISLFALIAIIVVAFAMPLTSNLYYMDLVVSIAFASIAGMSVRLVINAGQWHYGQAAFVMLGSYTSAMMVVKLGLPAELTIILAGLVSVIIAIAIGYPTLKTTTFAFSLITMILVMAGRQVIQVFRNVTGGTNGMTIPRIDDFTIFGYTVNMSSNTSTYFAVIVIFVIALLVMYRIDRSRLGTIFHTIRDSGSLAASLGINVVRYQVIAFAIAGLFGGLAGGVSAHYYQMVHPDMYNMMQSIYFVVYAIFGGLGSVFGPIIGSALLILIVQPFNRNIYLPPLIYAVVLVAGIMFFPGGLVELPKTVRGWITARQNKQAKPKTTVREK
jgi:branched-chain amino acid transport system permease protein